jgi:glycosyltransferase involved in cell wall biosynthesis
MNVACILPVHDEEGLLSRSAFRVLDWGRRRFGEDEFAVVVSENGSTDGTRREALELAAAEPAIVTVASDAPGKGGAVKRGALASAADAYLFMDVDLSTDLDSAARLVEAVAAGADLAIGSRRAAGARVKRSAYRNALSVAYASLAAGCLGLPVKDLQCGCKAFSRRLRETLLPDIKDDGFFFDTELVAKAARRGLRLEEIGVAWDEHRAPGRKSKVRTFRTFLDFLGKLRALRKELG